MKKKTTVFLCALFLLLMGSVSGFAQGLPIYDNIPNPLPANLASWGYEATGTSEFGDRVAFAPATGRAAKTVTVTMSSWGCQAGHWYGSDCITAPGATFPHPITLNIYSVGPGNAPGTLLATVSQTFAIPFRPSVDLINCTGGKWFDAGSNTCFNGKASNITFNLASLNLTLPNQVIFGVAYNTTHYGYAPIGQGAACYNSAGGCGYDSLNVGVTDPASSISVGSNPSPNDAYQYTLYSSCSNSAIIPFGLDPGCWTGFKPAVRFNASNPPVTKNDCKNGGWQTRTTASGKPFKSQAQCLDYVEDKKDNDDNKDNDDKKDKDEKDGKGDKRDH